jgi:glycosyltransferase involved in cell wall biosynthesis
MSLWGWHQLSRWLSRHQHPVVIYALDAEPVTLAIFLRLFPQALNDAHRLVIHVHNVPGERADDKKESPLWNLRKRVYGPSMRYLVEHMPTRFITNGASITEGLIRQGVADNLIHTSRWGTSLTPRIEESNRPARDSFLMLGIWRQEKNIPLVLQSLQLVTQPITLTIAGYPRDFDKSYLQSKINELGIEHHDIRIIDQYLDEQYYTSLLDEHQYLLLPYASHHASSSGPLIDGMMRNCIPIIAPGGERARLVQDQQVGLQLNGIRPEQIAEQINQCCNMADAPIDLLLEQISKVRMLYRWEYIIDEWLNVGLFDFGK